MSMGYMRANQVISCQIDTCSNVFSSVEAIKTYFPIRTLGILACYSRRFLTTLSIFPCITAIYRIYHIWMFPPTTPQNNSGTFHNTHRGLLVSDEIQSLFHGSTAYLLVTYSNQTSVSLEVIKRCITQNMLLQSWRRSSWPCGMFYSLSCFKMKGRAAALFRLTLQKVQW